MQDRQVEHSSTTLRIPILSPVLHCIAMTVIVFFRSSFGFVYLRPKSVFFAFSWAMTLFAIYAWIEQTVWDEYGLVCIFAVSSVALYWTHLAIAFTREIYRTGEHDHNSGTPHLLRLFEASPAFELRWKLWAEPALVLAAAILLRLLAGEQKLSAWLLIVAPCLWIKEALNFWFQLRQRKRHQDSQDDAAEIFGNMPNASSNDALKPARKEKLKRTRPQISSALEILTEQQMAQILQMTPPFTLEKAEHHYRQLVRQHHPDPPESLPGAGRETAELNRAIEFFRKRLVG